MKRFRDPVHSFVELPRHLVPLVDTYEFQRLRRLTQLGTSSFTYPGAEHSRFQHSLGVAHLFLRLARELDIQGSALTDEELLVGTCAALLHDVGHAPFSHALEGVLGKNHHEEWTQAIILSPEAEVHQVLSSYDSSLPQKVADVIGKRLPNTILVSMISSQLDVDRMDYLLRDSICVGVSYGRYDVDRLLRMVRRQGNRLVVDNRGLYNAQEFLFARYYMYWQVYFHPTTRGFELLLKALWQRAKELAGMGVLPTDGLSRALREVIHVHNTEPSIQQYLELDNHDIYVAIKTWVHSTDPILSDLARRLLRRELLKPIDATDPRLLPRSNDIRDVVQRAGFDPTYYMLYDPTSSVPYDYYIGAEAEESDKQPIYVLLRNNQLEEISRCSEPIRAIAGRRETKMRLYVPAECREQIETLLL